MPSPQQRHGAWAEKQAEVWLEAHGFTILDRHCTSRFGEIDILAQVGQEIVAVEVKARRTKKFGPAVAAISKTKYDRLEKTLHDIVAKRNLTQRPIRIDLVTVEPAGIEHIPGLERPG